MLVGGTVLSFTVLVSGVHNLYKVKNHHRNVNCKVLHSPLCAILLAKDFEFFMFQVSL